MVLMLVSSPVEGYVSVAADGRGASRAPVDPARAMHRFDSRKSAQWGAVMPAGSSKKRERQFEHIKESYQDRGVSTDEAEERAARTVNKERREHGETKGSKKKS
jgi:hypothetical protein